MTPSRPYLLRALNEWILDNQLTPYMVVDASISDVQVPRDFVSNGQIVLNISPRAVKSLLISNEAVEFNARFGGVPMHVYVPIVAVMAIYAKENGQGMVFGADPGAPDPGPGPGPGPKEVTGKPAKPDAGAPSKARKPSLKIVK